MPRHCRGKWCKSFYRGSYIADNFIAEIGTLKLKLEKSWAYWADQKKRYAYKKWCIRKLCKNREPHDKNFSFIVEQRRILSFI